MLLIDVISGSCEIEQGGVIATISQSVVMLRRRGVTCLDHYGVLSRGSASPPGIAVGVTVPGMCHISYFHVAVTTFPDKIKAN